MYVKLTPENPSSNVLRWGCIIYEFNEGVRRLDVLMRW
jgi:hypothetical protein